MKNTIKIDMTQMKTIQIIKIFDVISVIRKNLNKKGLDIKARQITKAS